jgi:hypothetical protein
MFDRAIAFVFVLVTVITSSACSSRPVILGEPLVVNGHEVSDRAIERWLIEGPCRMKLEMRRVALICDQEIDRRANEAAEEAIDAETWRLAHAANTADSSAAKNARAHCARTVAEKRKEIAARVTPTVDEWMREYTRSIDEFKANYPRLEVNAEVSRAFRSLNWYRVQLRQTMLFDRLFYPDDPEDWPPVTLAAVRADSGDTLLQDARDSYRMRKEHADKTGEALPKEDGIYVQMMRQIVRDAMFAKIDFKTSFDGLSDDLVLWADTNHDGKPELVVTTDKLWREVQDTVTPNDVLDAKRWFVTSLAVRDRLERDGSLLDEAACKEELAALKRQFEGTYFNVDILATQTHYFPSTESYTQYFCLSKGFERKVAPSIAPSEAGELAQPLCDHLERANRIIGLGQVDLECMLIAAFDSAKFQWKPDGWRWARREAEGIKREIDAHAVAWNAERVKESEAKAAGREFVPDKRLRDPYSFWTWKLDEHSEYWDAPPPEKGRASDVGMKKRGRFGLKYRNDLQGFVGETPYSHWVTGQSITDFTFFDQVEGTVAGPFKGPLGYYITRVQRRTEPTRPLKLDDSKHVELLRNDYLRVAFVEYAKEAVAQAEVKGWTPGD